MATRQLTDLPANSGGLDTDLYHTRQGATDKSLTGALVKAFVKWTNEGFYTVTGTDTYTAVAALETAVPDAYFDGQTVAGVFTTNTGAATINVASLGSKSIKINGGDPVAGEIDNRTVLIFDSSNDWFEILVGGVYTSIDKIKLDGIEANATVDQTASELLTAIKTVDGAGSGLDADLLDGSQGAFYDHTLFGLGGNAVATADIDAINQGGIFIVTGATLGVKPSGEGSGTLLHMERGSSNAATQIFDALLGGGQETRVFIRSRRNDGNYSTWRKIVQSGQSVTALAWVNLNGTGTIAIRASLNVSSVTDNGIGLYTTNFDNAMADADYVTLATDNLGGNIGSTSVKSSFTPTTAAIQTESRSIDATSADTADPSRLHIAIFGNN